VAALLALLVVHPACSILGPDNQELDTLRVRRGAWQKLAIVDYEVTLALSCFCDPDSLRPVRITVRDQLTVSIVDAASGAAVPLRRWPDYRSIDELFDWLDTFLQQRENVARVTYDSTYHFPVQMSGYTKDTLDSGVGYELSDFEEH
jgi:hypothetical protein